MGKTIEKLLLAVAGSLLTFIMGFITLRGQVLNSKADREEMQTLQQEVMSFSEKGDAALKSYVDTRFDVQTKHTEQIVQGINEQLKQIKQDQQQLIQLVIQINKK